MITKPTLLLLSLPMAVTLSAKEQPPSPAQTAHVQSGQVLTPGGIVAGQITDILETKGLSEKSRKRQIANAVRIAIVSATTNVKKSDDALALVLEVAQSAGGAAPEFSTVIGEAVFAAAGHIPVLAAVENLQTRVNDAVFAGVKQAAAASGEAHFDSDEGRSHGRPQGNAQGEHEFGGRDHDVIVSQSEKKDSK